MCLAAMLDLHAAARRDSQRTIPARTNWNVLEASRKDTTNLSYDASAAPVTGTDAEHRASLKKQQKPRAPKGLRAYSKKEVQRLIRLHASRHGLDPDLPLAIAQCESGFRWDAANGRSSARGVFQYLSGTWRTTKEGRKGTSVLDTEAHIRMAVTHIATSGTSPWNASRDCWQVTEADAGSQDVPETDRQSQDASQES